MKFKFILSLLALLTCKKGQSHALWNETSPIGTFHKPHQIKAFSREYAPQGIKLLQIGPENPKNQLETQRSPDHFESSIKSVSQGMYHVMAVHPAQGPYERKTIESSPNSYVKVGDSSKENFKTGYWNKLLPKKLREGNSIQTSIIAETAAMPYIDMDVIPPSRWTETLYSNLTGKNPHNSAVTGIYFVETSFLEEKSSNRFRKAIGKIWRSSVTSAMVN